MKKLLFVLLMVSVGAFAQESKNNKKIGVSGFFGGRSVVQCKKLTN